YQQEPWSILWSVRSDGTLLSFSYNREDNVTAWNRHSMGNSGLVESICVIPAPDGSRDENWVIVARTINGATVRTVEYSAKPYEGPQAGYAGDAQSSCWYVDCGGSTYGIPINGGTQSLVEGLPSVYFNQTIAVLADGGVQPLQHVDGFGEFTLTGNFSSIIYGFPYQANLVPVRFEGGADAGTAQGKRKQGAT